MQLTCVYNYISTFHTCKKIISGAILQVNTLLVSINLSTYACTLLYDFIHCVNVCLDVLHSTDE